LLEITCPTWWGVSADQHASRLWDNEGRCVHQTGVTVVDPVGKQVPDETPKFCPPIELVLQVTTDLAGREVESADVLINGQESNLEQLAQLANVIFDLGEMYRSTLGRRMELEPRMGRTEMTDSARSLLLLIGRRRRRTLPRREGPSR
jgi:hypothetical protein